MISRWRQWLALAATITCLLLPSCGKNDQPPSAAPPTAASAAATEIELAAEGEIIVSVASSTKEVMEALATEFSEQTKFAVKVNPGPSNGLANQILQGAPADLFLSANRQWAEQVSEAGLAEKLHPLLTNKLVIIVPQGNPAQVQGPQDLASDRVQKIALAGEKVPAGMYADQALTRLGLLAELSAAGKIARGQDVRSALSYVERGEAEAGIVYATDVSVASSVEQVHAFEPELHDEIAYVLVLLKHGARKPAAKQLFGFLQSQTANEAYAQAGFERLTDQ